jgi:glycosyltransferase involved in cell wall biosynthesis
MTNADAVVVVIPFFNGTAFIERAVRSVMNQTCPANEIIVVDDGSLAPEAKVLADLSTSLGFAVIRQDNAGQSSARNMGVANSSSPLICFLDQDDYFLPDHIDKLVSAWTTEGSPSVGYVYGDAQRVDLNGDLIHERVIKSHSTHPKLTTVDFLTSDMFILPSASIISREMYSAIGGFHSELRGYEDDDFFLRAHFAGFRGIHLDVPVVAWTLNPDSSSHSPTMAQSRLTYLHRVIALIASLPEAARCELETHIYPRFVSLFAYDLAAPLAVGNEFSMAESRFHEVVDLCRTSGVTLTNNTRIIITIMGLLGSLPIPLRRAAARVLVSPLFRKLRALLKRQ